MQQWRKIYNSMFDNEDLGNLAVQIRHLKVGLISIADDDGRFKASAKYIKAKVFPYDDFSHEQIRNWLDKLADLKEPQLTLYDVNGELYGYHPNWYRYNKVRSDRYITSIFPPPPNQATEWQPDDNQEDTKCQPVGSVERKERREKKEEKGRFTPPSLLAVKTYCQERKNIVNPENFINFYESKGWLIGKNKMKDWRAAVRTWEQRNKKDAPPEIKKTILPEISPEQIKLNQQKLAKIREQILKK